MHEKTKVVFKGDARRGLLDGMMIVGEAVGCTLGPRGKTVIIQTDGAPIVTKDGVTVSKSIKLKDPVMAMGADLIKQAAERTNEVAGDGTTTSTVLTYAMVEEGNRLISNGNNAQLICQGIDIAVEALIKNLKSQAQAVKTTEELASVATISANGDAKIGELVAQALERVGRNGVITVEDAKGTTTNMEVVEGLQFERGYLSPYFVNNPERMHASYENMRVLITDKKLSDIRQLIPIMEQVVQTNASLLIIADDVEGDALQGLVLNRVRANMKVTAVKAPGYGTFRDELLADLCVLTGATLVSSKTGVSFDKMTMKELGLIKRGIVDAKTTTLVAEGKTQDGVKARVKELESQIQDVTLSAEEIEKLRNRIAGLSAGVAVIRVGGSTELEMVERKHRIEDALHATRAAAEEGIVAGGGTALIRAAKDFVFRGEADVELGVKLVQKACQAPLRRIVTNANGSPDVILDKLPGDALFGYDARTETFRDMFEAGIVDPVKVCRSALQHAASVAVTFLQLDAVVYNEETTNDVQR